MKKSIVLLLTSIMLMSVSCKKKTETTPEVTTETVIEKGYKVSAQGSKVYWTGYKFTEKKAVKGEFKTLNVTYAPLASTPIEAFNGVEFTIPVSSIFSDNAIRDGKLMTLFFGFMENTELLSGSFSTKGDQLFLNLKMNNATKEIPLTYSVADRHVRVEGSINMLDFGATKAYNSIHKACELLHTGTDGVSKTWEDVAIEAIVFLSEK